MPHTERSEISKRAWRARKREGGKGIDPVTGKPVFAGGVKVAGRLMHKTSAAALSLARKMGLTGSQSMRFAREMAANPTHPITGKKISKESFFFARVIYWRRLTPSNEVVQMGTMSLASARARFGLRAYKELITTRRYDMGGGDWLELVGEEEDLKAIAEGRKFSINPAAPGRSSCPPAAPAVARAEAAAPLAAKQPWQMTRKEFAKTTQLSITEKGTTSKLRMTGPIGQLGAPPKGRLIIGEKTIMNSTRAKENTAFSEMGTQFHRARVEKALSEGKPVPAEVLADYPDLAAQPSSATAGGGNPAAPGKSSRPPAAELLTNPTARQAAYIRALMIDAGHAHPRGFLRGSSKYLPHGPSMRERGGSVDEWIARLTVGQASDVINALKKGKNPRSAPGKSSRPPAAWFVKMRARVKAGYPSLRHIRREPGETYQQAIGRITAGIWHKYSRETQEELVARYEGGNPVRSRRRNPGKEWHLEQMRIYLEAMFRARMRYGRDDSYSANHASANEKAAIASGATAKEIEDVVNRAMSATNKNPGARYHQGMKNWAWEMARKSNLSIKEQRFYEGQYVAHEISEKRSLEQGMPNPGRIGHCPRHSNPIPVGARARRVRCPHGHYLYVA